MLSFDISRPYAVLYSSDTPLFVSAGPGTLSKKQEEQVKRALTLK